MVLIRKRKNRFFLGETKDQLQNFLKQEYRDSRTSILENQQPRTSTAFTGKANDGIHQQREQGKALRELQTIKQILSKYISLDAHRRQTIGLLWPGCARWCTSRWPTHCNFDDQICHGDQTPTRHFSGHPPPSAAMLFAQMRPKLSCKLRTKLAERVEGFRAYKQLECPSTMCNQNYQASHRRVCQHMLVCPTDIRPAAMDALVEQPVQSAYTCRGYDNTDVHMAGQTVQPALTCTTHAHMLSL